MIDNSSNDIDVVYDDETGEYTATYDPDVLAPSIAVVEATAAIRQVDPERHAPLFEVIDPEALDRVCTRRDGETTITDETFVEFTYLAHRIRVSSAGRIIIAPTAESDETDDSAPA